MNELPALPSRRIELSRPVELIVPASPAWPSGLRDLTDTPTRLYVAGELPRFEDAVAIVGTRFADEEAIAFTEQLAAAFASSGLCVVSGGAEGIDAAAHRGALAAGGSTVAVLASGLSQAYPAHHGPLFGEIARSGCLLSEDKEPARHAGAFLQRNRLIAALAGAVVVVQAPFKSGALSTAAVAKRLKRHVFAAPAAAWDARGAGCLLLLSQGARICTSAADVLSLRPFATGQACLPCTAADSPSRLPSRSAPLPQKSDRRSNKARGQRLRQHQESNDDKGLPEPSRRVLRELDKGSAHPDRLAQTLDMPAGTVQEALLTLQLAGLARRRADGSYSKAR